MSNSSGGPVPLAAESLDALRQRTSVKWRLYPPDVLPLFVAEMDYPIAPAVRDVLIDLARRSDTGYVTSPEPVAAAFAQFAGARWGWDVAPEGIRTTTDVGVAIVETLRQAIRPGEAVVVTPPVYPPFFDLIPEAGGVVAEVPLLGPEGGWRLDLASIDRAFAAGARALLLCSPHNPVGLVHDRETLAEVARIANRHGAIVVSDEIHGPLTHSDAVFTPFLSVSDVARSVGVTVTSASKGWNLAGLKCALMVAQAPESLALLDAMPVEVGYRTSLFGLHASTAAFARAGQWLDSAVAAIEQNRRLLTDLLAQHLPEVRYLEPTAGYLAWLDFSKLGWGADPSEPILDRARVALNPGPAFGPQGEAHARLNLACASEVLSEAIERIGAL